MRTVAFIVGMLLVFTTLSAIAHNKTEIRETLYKIKEWSYDSSYR